MLLDDIDFEPKLNLPLVVCMDFKDYKYEYVVLWTKKEQYKIIDEYFLPCKFITQLLGIIFDYSIYPSLS